MFKRVTIVALVVAAFVLVMAVPALAFNGMRSDYTVSGYCAGCHKAGQPGSAPKVYDGWLETKHGENEAFAEVANRIPTGSVCQGCHTANFDPAKMTPQPTATTYSMSTPLSATSTPTATATAWGYTTDASGTQEAGNGAWSAENIGCSSCHYGAAATGTNAQFGNDVNDTAHMAPLAEMANADICGSCHSRYSYTVDTYAITAIPTPGATAVIQPQMALGTTGTPWKFLGQPKVGGWNPAAALSTVLTIPHAGPTPWQTPAPTATSGGTYEGATLMTYWKVPSGQTTVDTPWQLVGHEGSAAQYPEWAGEGHAAALTTLTSQSFWGFLPETTKQECLECHSADFRILKEAGRNPQSADVKYGITCVGCHAPHEAGTVRGAWDDEWDAQLVNDAQLGGNGSNLCTECHNGEIPAGSTASPGAEIHHPMKEMMDGYGAIDVQSFPSVHKGKCIQCHMPPTSYSRGSVQAAGNHTFEIIQPAVANDVVPIPITTATSRSTATPTPAATTTPLALRAVVTTTFTKTQDTMPYSACSTCHNNNQKPTPVPVSTTLATTIPVATASPILVTATVTQNVANQGDKALWLQATIEQRQEWTKAKVTEIWAELDTAARHLGYADTDAAHTALVAVPAAEWTTAERAFLSGFTNVEFVESEGSFGIHNWDYSRAIVNTAMMQARIAATGVIVRTPWVVTLKMSKSNIRAGARVKFSGSVKTKRGVAGAGSVRIMRRVSGKWQVWLRDKLNASGKYSVTQKVTKRGTYRIRAFMPANSLNLGAYSSKSLKLNVRR